MAKYNIEHDRPNCIGCAACCAIMPEQWSMGDDGKSNFKEADFEEDKLAPNKQAAEVCPVNVIHIIKDGKEKLI